MNSDAASLDRLHDIIAPPAAPWWPPAPGWYWLLGFAALIVLALTLRAVILWQRNRYRREALAELAILEHEAMIGTARASALAGISELLKRTALTAFPRPQVASLTGGEWIAFLDRTGGTAFSRSTGQALQDVVADPRTASNWSERSVADLVVAARQWIRDHRPDEPASSRS